MSDPATRSSRLAAEASANAGIRAQLEDYYELTKPRLSFLSVLTAIVGYLAANPARDLGTLFAVLFGTSLAAGGAAVLNQWLERDADAKMARTRDRAIPAGRIEPGHALAFGLVLSAIGCGSLYWGANALAGLLTLATIASYVLLYTPLKRVTAWNTIIGAVPGALPPLIGWAAAEGSIGTLGWLLFAILFLWQLPHFYAIAWKHRSDYANGGFVMVSNFDASGRKVATQAFAFTVALVVFSVLPSYFGYATWVYGGIAILAGAYILKPAFLFLRSAERDSAARRLFLASVFYLPALLVPLVLDLWLL